MLGFQPIGKLPLGALPSTENIVVYTVATAAGGSQVIGDCVQVAHSIAAAAGLAVADVAVLVRANVDAMATGSAQADFGSQAVAYSTFVSLGEAQATVEAISTADTLALGVGMAYAYAIGASVVFAEGHSYANAVPYLFYSVSDHLCVPEEDRVLVVGCGV